jgi:geranylgeranyl pyrophosphate synthase
MTNVIIINIGIIIILLIIIFDKKLHFFEKISTYIWQPVIHKKKSFDIKIDHINAIITAHIEQKSYLSQNFKTMYKDAINNGKRVRSIIIDSLCDDPVGKKSAIIFIEIIHACTLILDDIMDKDVYRRDNLCIYKKYGVHNAQLLTIYMLSDAMMEMCKFINRYKCIELLPIINECMQKLSIGQYIDINAENEDINIIKLMDNKTGILFELTYILAFIIKKFNTNKSNAVTNESNAGTNESNAVTNESNIISLDVDNINKNRQLEGQLDIPRLDVEFDRININSADIVKIKKISQQIGQLLKLTDITQSDVTSTDIYNMQVLGRQFGRLFQMADDYNDRYTDKMQCNYILTKGINKSKIDFVNLLNEFICNSIKLKMFAPNIEYICNYLNFAK